MDENNQHYKGSSFCFESTYKFEVLPINIPTDVCYATWVNSIIQVEKLKTKTLKDHLKQ